MSLLRQLPLVDSRLFPLANLKITCWCISYCCSGDVVIYSPAFFMSTFILISGVQNSSFSSNSISFGVMHLLTYNEGRSFCTCRRKEAWYIAEKNGLCTGNHKLWSFFHVKSTTFILYSSSPNYFSEENNVSPHRATRYYLSFWGLITYSYTCRMKENAEEFRLAKPIQLLRNITAGYVHYTECLWDRSKLASFTPSTILKMKKERVKKSKRGISMASGNLDGDQTKILTKMPHLS